MKKKLALSRTTIRIISDAQLGHAAGGDSFISCGCGGGPYYPRPPEPPMLPPIPPPPPSFGPPAQCWP